MEANMGRKIFLLVVCGILMLSGVATAEETCRICHPDIAKNFSTSLHHTIAGIYAEFNKGAGKEFRMSLPAGCTKCHIDNCTTCHEGYGGYPGAHYNRAVNMSLCVECHHARAGVNYVGYLGGHKKRGPSADIHYQLGLNCTDCHTPSEIHGNGELYNSEKQAVKVRCEDCHSSPGTGKVVNGMQVMQFSTEIPAHRIHAGKLDCSACHAAWMQTCYNCHLETKKVDKSYVDKFYLGVGYEGKIKPFYYQRVSKGNKSYDRWVEWTPHTISAKAHNCSFCHLNKEVLGAERTGIILGPEGASFIPEKTIDEIYGVTSAPAPGATAKPTVTTSPTTAAKPTSGFELVLAAIGVSAALLVRKIKM